MERFLIVCGAGAAGCGARYLLSLWTAKRFGPGFPWGTLIVNITGSFLIALVLGLQERISPNVRLALVTGFLGGLTTYSSFNFETTALLQSSPLRGALNLAATVLGCLVAGYLGLVLARRLA